MKLTIWAKINKTGFDIISPYNKAKAADFRNERIGKLVKIIFEDKEPPKSEDALGLYFGGVIPAIIAQDKNLVHRGQLKNNPFILKDLMKEKKITSDEVEQYHRDIMLSFRPTMATDIKTKEPSKVGQELKHFNNRQLVELITEIYDWAQDNYEMPDTEEYKKFRDEAKYIKEHGTIPYPEDIKGKTPF